MKFIWADLSANELKEAKNFYKKVLDWSMYKQKERGEEYSICYSGSKATAGIFDMPDFFRSINMPSFWMSYLQVEDVSKTIAAAKKHDNVIIEIESTPFYKGNIALIRDPAGAGFTIYDGKGLNSNGNNAGQVAWNELFLDSIKKVQAFYENVFDLQIKQISPNRYELYNRENELVAGITELSDKNRGGKVYWLPFFGVKDMNKTIAKIQKNSGEVIQNSDGSAVAYDSQHAAFGVTELK